MATLADGAPQKAFRQSPYLIPMHAQFTGDDPMRRLYRLAAELSAASAVQVELAVGFTGGDFAACGPSILAYARSSEEAEAAANTLFESLLAVETEFDCALPDAEDAVQLAMSAPAGSPVVIADVQDNPGGGTSSDTTGLLRALVGAGAKGAVVAVMHDPAVARKAHAAGVGAEFRTALGGRAATEGDAPFEADFRVDALSDGKVIYEGDMYGGGIAEMGPTALLTVVDEISDVQVIVSTVRNQCLDRGYFRHIGVEPEKTKILCVKSTVHYRADFDPISQLVISAASPGSLLCDLTKVPYGKLRQGVRLGPGGPIFNGARQPRTPNKTVE